MKLFGYEINFRKLELPKDEEKRSAFSGYYGSDALTFGSLGNHSSGASNLSAYYRGVDIISDSLAILPVKVAFKNGELNEAHPLNSILENHYLLVKMLIESTINRGNGYAYIERDVNLNVKAFLSL